MKNKLEDLNNHLFAQLERLGEEDLSVDQIESESKRAQSIVDVADTLLESAKITVSAMKVATESGLRLGENQFFGLEKK